MREWLAKAAVKTIGSDVLSAVLYAGQAYGRMPRLGTRQLLRAYNELPWLRAVGDKVARSVGHVAWRAVVPTKNGKAILDRRLQRAGEWERRAILTRLQNQGELRELTNHPILDFLDGGNKNPFFHGHTIRELSTLYLDFVGEAAWLMDRDALNMPIGCYPIPPTWVIEIPTVSRNTFQVFAPGGGSEIPTDQVLWHYHPDPQNPYSRGSGLGMTLGDELETDEYTAKHVKTWFTNRAMPEVLISGNFSAEEKTRIETSWKNRFQGYMKHWLPMFLSRDVKLTPISQTFENMQLIELRKYERDIVIQTWGVPPECFGIVENSNRSTIDAAQYMMGRFVTVPRLEFFRATWQKTLVPQFDERIVLLYDTPVQEDRAFELEVMKAVPWAYRIDEWRAKSGQPPLDNDQGRLFAIPFSQTLVHALTPEAPPPAPTVATPAPVPPTKRLRGQRALSAAGVASIVNAAAPGVLIDEAKPQIRAAIDHFAGQTWDLIHPKAAAGLKAGDDVDADALAGDTFNLADPRVTDFLRAWGADRIGGLVNETTRDAIRQAVTNGLDTGATMDAIADAIKDVFDQADGARALLIARTELVRASNFAALEAMRQGAIEEKEWLSTQDSRVRDEDDASHVDLDGQVVPLGDPFEDPANGNQAMYPGDFGEPAEDCNCRCGVVAVIPGKATAAQRVTQWKAIEAARAPFQRALAAALRRGFARQRTAVLAALETHKGAQWQAA